MKSWRAAVAAVIAVAGAVVLPIGARAATNLVLNGDFSMAVPGTGPLIVNSDVVTVYGVSNLADWSCGPGYCGNLNSVNQPTAPIGDLTNGYTPNLHNPTGQNFFYEDADPVYTASLYQTINGLVGGENYNLTFYDAFVNENVGTVGNTAGWSVSLGGQTNSTGLVGVSPTGNDWSQVVMNFTATSASEVLTFTAVGAGFPPFALIQDVSLTSAAPEPGAWALIIVGVGAMGCALRVRRRKTLARSY